MKRKARLTVTHHFGVDDHFLAGRVKLAGDDLVQFVELVHDLAGARVPEEAVGQDERVLFFK